ncbi:hypothetical protein SFHH103_02730 [Sinorhizobium fredii HH103]|uniref:Uncharacterized protein n=1 Tax=Sinorhizobium fredii (strain HH103) TaxID=1117943 RepID=G9ABD3_SINF1|nr:hypothetical protein AOX55_00003109 [Sinorhizobium fredii CCBAU 25509]CCE97224.1 hypothetical protein SFHH103_02730 [Sinorhizobium fredii HH103]
MPSFFPVRFHPDIDTWAHLATSEEAFARARHSHAARADQ